MVEPATDRSWPHRGARNWVALSPAAGICIDLGICCYAVGTTTHCDRGAVAFSQRAYFAAKPSDDLQMGVVLVRRDDRSDAAIVGDPAKTPNVRYYGR